MAMRLLENNQADSTMPLLVVSSYFEECNVR